MGYNMLETAPMEFSLERAKQLSTLSSQDTRAFRIELATQRAAKEGRERETKDDAYARRLFKRIQHASEVLNGERPTSQRWVNYWETQMPALVGKVDEVIEKLNPVVVLSERKMDEMFADSNEQVSPQTPKESLFQQARPTEQEIPYNVAASPFKQPKSGIWWAITREFTQGGDFEDDKTPTIRQTLELAATAPAAVGDMFKGAWNFLRDDSEAISFGEAWEVAKTTPEAFGDILRAIINPPGGDELSLMIDNAKSGLNSRWNAFSNNFRTLSSKVASITQSIHL
jgi:hypothetical protein